jgi:hypothetical protein
MDLWSPFSGFLDHTGLLWQSDQPVAETFTYTGQHNIQTSVPRAGFEPATPATKRPQTYALDRASTRISSYYSGRRITASLGNVTVKGEKRCKE